MILNGNKLIDNGKIIATIEDMSYAPLLETAEELRDMVDEMENITNDQRLVLARSYGNEIVDDLPEYAIGIIEGTPADDTPVKDFEAVSNWLDTWPQGTTFSYLDDSHFSWNPEFGLPCQCVTCIVHKGEEESKDHT